MLIDFSLISSKVIRLLQRRFSHCDETFLESDQFHELIRNARQQIKQDPSNKYVYIKTLVTALKDNRVKTACGSRPSSSKERSSSSSEDRHKTKHKGKVKEGHKSRSVEQKAGLKSRSKHTDISTSPEDKSRAASYNTSKKEKQNRKRHDSDCSEDTAKGNKAQTAFENHHQKGESVGSSTLDIMQNDMDTCEVSSTVKEVGARQSTVKRAHDKGKKMLTANLVINKSRLKITIFIDNESEFLMIFILDLYNQYFRSVAPWPIRRFFRTFCLNKLILPMYSLFESKKTHQNVR